MMKQNVGRMLKWSFQSIWMSLVIFYSILVALYIISTAVVLSFDRSTIDISVSTGASQIMLFTLGIILFSQGLRVALMHGVSRRSAYCAFLITCISLPVVMAALDTLISMAFYKIDSGPITDVFFHGGTVIERFFALAAEGFLAMALGFFISAAYYRMNKLTKILVSVLVPVTLFAGVPLLVVLTGFHINPNRQFDAFLFELVKWIQQSYLTISLLMCLVALLCLLFVWLLMRRAPAKPTTV